MRPVSREHKLRLHCKTSSQWSRKNPECVAFVAAKQRCNNPNHPVYHLYGGRGIKFKLKSWKEIVLHLGRRPKGMTLDRINNDGHYELNNLRWATRKQQCINKRIVNQTGFCREAIIC
jgi:hypothetical protein